MEDTKCLVELDELLKYLNYEELIKIPNEIRNAINKEKDKSYVWKYDVTKSLTEQNLNRKTVAMLSYLNMEYLLNYEEKQIMEELHKFNEKKCEKENINLYRGNNIFERQNIEAEKNKTMLSIVKKDRWYKKIFLTLKKIFKR